MQSQMHTFLPLYILTTCMFAPLYVQYSLQKNCDSTSHRIELGGLEQIILNALNAVYHFMSLCIVICPQSVISSNVIQNKKPISLSQQVFL